MRTIVNEDMNFHFQSEKGGFVHAVHNIFISHLCIRSRNWENLRGNIIERICKFILSPDDSKFSIGESEWNL